MHPPLHDAGAVLHHPCRSQYHLDSRVQTAQEDIAELRSLISNNRREHYRGQMASEQIGTARKMLWKWYILSIPDIFLQNISPRTIQSREDFHSLAVCVGCFDIRQRIFIFNHLLVEQSVIHTHTQVTVEFSSSPRPLGTPMDSESSQQYLRPPIPAPVVSDFLIALDLAALLSISLVLLLLVSAGSDTGSL